MQPSLDCILYLSFNDWIVFCIYAVQVDLLTEDQPEAIRSKLLPALMKGVASHHAGHLPGWKSLVERLFQR
eukprot:66924-Pelagomonas_calceolata.AAC.4